MGQLPSLRDSGSHTLGGCMRIELNCAECGRNRFTIVKAMGDHEAVYCSDCGHEIGTMADLKERIAAEVMKRATNPS